MTKAPPKPGTRYRLTKVLDDADRRGLAVGDVFTLSTSCFCGMCFESESGKINPVNKTPHFMLSDTWEAGALVPFTQAPSPEARRYRLRGAGSFEKSQGLRSGDVLVPVSDVGDVWIMTSEAGKTNAIFSDLGNWFRVYRKRVEPILDPQDPSTTSFIGKITFTVGGMTYEGELKSVALIEARPV
jgi:hypothetical protein